MKNSIKRAQSQACLGFAEQKNFRPLAKLKKLSLTLLLLITAVAGAWADNVEAKIGTTEYATLGEAISSAQDGDIIQLQSDVVLAIENFVKKKELPLILTVTSSAELKTPKVAFSGRWI